LSPFLTTKEAAEYLRYRSASAVRTLKMRGLLVPAGKRGKTYVYRIEDLNRFIENGNSGRIVSGQSEVPGEGRVDEKRLDKRLRADQVSRDFQIPNRFSRKGARDEQKNRETKGGKQKVRQYYSRESSRASAGDEKGDTSRDALCRAEKNEVCRLRRVLVEEENRYR